MAGAAAGLMVGFIGVPGGLGGAIVYGMVAGSASGVATQMTANALTGQPLHEGVLEAAVVGGVSGGLFAGVGYGAGRAFAAWRGGTPPGPNPVSILAESDPVAVANSRAVALQKALPSGARGRITMAAGVVEDASGARYVVVSSSEPGSYIRPTVKSAINPKEVVVSGSGHAEAKIVNWAKVNNYKVIAVGAGRPVCPNCVQAIEDVGGVVASPWR
jgi:hypothetical protein